MAAENTDDDILFDDILFSDDVCISRTAGGE